MVLPLALLCSASMAVMVVIIGKQFSEKRLVKSRVSAQPSTPVPETTRSKVHRLKKATLEGAGNDKLARDLFMAGFHSKKVYQKYQWMQQAALGAPLLILGALYLKNGSLPPKQLMLACVIGGVLYFMVKKHAAGLVLRRQRIIEDEIPFFLDLLVLSVESGLAFTSAIPVLLKELGSHTPLTEEFQTLHREYTGGLSMGKACDRLSQRCNVPTLAIIMGNIVQSEKVGTSMADTLRILSSETRQKYRQRMREKAMTIPNKITFPSLLIFIALFIVMLGPTLVQMVTLQ